MRSVLNWAGGVEGVIGGGPRRFPVGVPAPEDVLCVHFSVDGRSHGMWFVEAGSPPESVPVEQWAHWHGTSGDVWTGRLLRGTRVMVDAVLCTEVTAGRRVRLREHIGASRAALLAPLRQRPLLATFARAVNLSLDQARLAHQLLVRAAVDSAGTWEDVVAPRRSSAEHELLCR